MGADGVGPSCSEPVLTAARAAAERHVGARCGTICTLVALRWSRTLVHAHAYGACCLVPIPLFSSYTAVSIISLFIDVIQVTAV